MIQLRNHFNDNHNVVPHIRYLNTVVTFEFQLKECYLCLFKTVTYSESDIKSRSG